jgi:sec-independent protein translocase protein TatB
MFGLSWGQITIIVLVGVFVLGPERIPTAVHWVTDGLRKLRTMAAGAQAQLNREIGPELDELRRQIADLQSLKDLQELRELRDLHPKRLIGNTILGEEFAGGGISGFLGLTGVDGTAKGAPISSPIGTVKPVSAVPPSAVATEVPLPAPPPVAVSARTGRLPAAKVVGAPRRVATNPGPNPASSFDLDAT